MSNLKGSRTEQNLKDAFAGESMANRRYLYFAAKADAEGCNDVSAVFRSITEGETDHAHGHLEYLEAVGDPAAGLPFGETHLNLKNAIAGETHEYTDMFTEVATIERSSGHDGTYGVKHATYALSRKLAKPVENHVEQAHPDYFTSDCPMAGGHIAHGLDDKPAAEHPLSLLRKAYGI